MALYRRLGFHIRGETDRKYEMEAAPPFTKNKRVII